MPGCACYLVLTALTKWRKFYFLYGCCFYRCFEYFRYNVKLKDLNMNFYVHNMVYQKYIKYFAYSAV